jgi:hypothetical protein
MANEAAFEESTVPGHAEAKSLYCGGFSSQKLRSWSLFRIAVARPGRVGFTVTVPMNSPPFVSYR